MQRKVIGRAAALKPNNQDPTFISFHSLCISESLFVIVVALQTDVAVGGEEEEVSWKENLKT